MGSAFAAETATEDPSGMQPATEETEAAEKAAEAQEVHDLAAKMMGVHTEAEKAEEEAIEQAAHPSLGTEAATETVSADTEGAVQIEQGEFKGQYHIPPPPAKTEAELEAGRKKLLEEEPDLDMFGAGESFVCEDSDEEEPEANGHLKKDPYDNAASRIA